MNSSSRGTRIAVTVLPWVWVVILTALNLLYMVRLGPNDDAYITFRVARNLATGRGPVFNPGEHVLSITTPGYMLLLAAASMISKDFVRLGFALNGLALLATGALLIDLSSADDEVGRGAGQRGLLSLLSSIVAISLTLTFPLLTAAIGMETPLFMAAILAAFAAYRRALRLDTDRRSEMRWLLATAVAAALAFLLRPDGLLIIVAIGMHWLVTRRRIPWWPIALFLALSLPWLVFSWLYYGSPVPNTLVAKETQALAESVPRWGPGLVQASSDWVRQFPIAAVLAVTGLVLALARRRSDRLAMLLWAALTIAAHSLLGVRSYFWYYAPLIPVAALLAGDGAAAAVGGLAGWLRLRRSAGLATGFAALALLLATLVPAASAAASLAQPAVPRRREQAYLQTGEFLHEMCASREDAPRVGMAEIGLIGYASDCPIVDFAGLLQREIAHLRVSPADKATWAILHYQPELVVLSGGTGYPFAPSNSSWFRKRYELEHKTALEGYLSLVYRRGIGPENQRDLPGAAWWRAVESTKTIEQSLYFAPDASPAITLHAFLPPESILAVNANGQPITTLVGNQPTWQDIRLPAIAPVDGPLTLSVTGSAGDQAAAVAWIESNALPVVHYFAPFDDVNTRPRPTIQIDPGASLTVHLARPSQAPVALKLFYRDRPGVRLAVFVDGDLRDVAGGTDEWHEEHLPLPDAPVYEIELRNQGDVPVRVFRVALVIPFSATTIEERP